MADSNMRFDGFDVTIGEGSFTGRFDIDEDTLKSMRFGDTVSFITTTTIGGAGMDTTKTGDLRRTNKFVVTSATVLNPKAATRVLAILNQPDSRTELEGQTNIIDDTDAGTMIVANGRETAKPKSIHDNADPELRDFLYQDAP